MILIEYPPINSSTENTLCKSIKNVFPGAYKNKENNTWGRVSFTFQIAVLLTEKNKKKKKQKQQKQQKKSSNWIEQKILWHSSVMWFMATKSITSVSSYFGFSFAIFCDP